MTAFYDLKPDLFPLVVRFFEVDEDGFGLWETEPIEVYVIDGPGVISVQGRGKLTAVEIQYGNGVTTRTDARGTVR